MDFVNKNIYYKIKLINYVLDSNKQGRHKIFSQEKEFIKAHLMNLEEELFYTALVIFNYFSYSGYYACQERELLQDWVIKENSDLEPILTNAKVPWLEEEKIILKLWLEKCLYGCADIKYKFLVQTRKEFNMPNELCDFKYTIKLSDGKEYEVFYILKQIIENKHSFNSREKEWLEKNYKKEIKIISQFLEEEIFQQVK
jgi:hypothetical protein